jgi:hypothetical protein
MTRLACIAALAALVAGCASAPAPPRSQVLSIDAAPGDYPCVLRDPREWPVDFIVQQTIEIRAVRDGRPVEGQLDAVVQKKGDTLLIIGLGPMNARAFTLTQRGRRIEFEQFAGPRLPFSPRNILVDVHRVFFKALPRPEGAADTGVVRGVLDGERVEERWERGELRARSFARPGSDLHGAVRVEYGPGCRAGRCEPASVTVHNEWFGYTLAITNREYEALD